MTAEDFRKRIEVLSEQRAWIDNAIATLDSQLEALEMQSEPRRKSLRS